MNTRKALPIFDINLQGDSGGCVEIRIPNFSSGKKFERWSTAQISTSFAGQALMFEIGVERSDVVDLAAALSDLKPGASISWATMERGLELNISVSLLGKADLNFCINGRGEFWREIQVSISVPLTQLEEQAGKLLGILESGSADL